MEIEEIKVTGPSPAKAKRQDKRYVRRQKRLAIKKINVEATIDRLQKKLETIEQKRDPYSHGGPAKPN
jgi:hypothetical protein